MKMRRKLGLAFGCLIAVAGPATAQEWIVGAGFAEFSRQGSHDSGILALEYHAAPFYTHNRLQVGWAGAGVVDFTGDVFIGAGLAATFALGPHWFIENSVLPGAYFEQSAGNDLGSIFEIRSLLGVGYRMDNGTAVSLALAHKSNASTASSNPGVNSALLRWHISF